MKYIYTYLYETGIFEYYKIYTNLIIQCKYLLILYISLKYSTFIHENIIFSSYFI